MYRSMPCISATNVHFITAEEQQRQPAKGHSGGVSSRRLPALSESEKRECVLMMQSKGKDFFEPPRWPSKIKPKFRQYVKAKVPVLTYQDQERLRNAAKVITVEERLDALAKQEELTKLKNEQAERSRIYFRKIDDQRLAEAEADAAKAEEDLSGNTEKQRTLDVAFIEKQEQEEEVRAVNRFILHAKCQAIRDAQMKEKKEIERNRREEEIRLEQMVIDNNAKALALEDTLALQQRDRCAKYAEEIRQQLLQRENMRFMEADRAQEMARSQREANAAMKRDEERIAREAKERRTQFRSELDRIVEMSNLFKKMLCEQEREADMRVVAYMREKRAREEQLQREKQLAREEFERKQELLYQLARKLMASKSQREELSYLREQEHAEREYRRREKESALRRKQLEDEIRESRDRQLQEMKTRQALQIAREEKNFNSMIASLKREEERLRKQEEERERQRECYRAAITRQMRDKAEAHRRLLEYERNENNIWREAERTRLSNVRAVVGAKLAAMREACLPEHYIKDIERQMDRIIKRNPQSKPQKS